MWLSPPWQAKPVMLTTSLRCATFAGFPSLACGAPAALRHCLTPRGVHSFSSACHPLAPSSPRKWSRSVVSDSRRPQGLQPTRLLRPWHFPGKSPGVGCHCLLRSSPRVFPNSLCQSHHSGGSNQVYILGPNLALPYFRTLTSLTAKFIISCKGTFNTLKFT